MKSKIIGIVLLALLIGGGYTVYHLMANIDAYVKQAIEDAGSEATGAQVAVAGVAIDLTSGRGEVSGITVANPPGYTGEHLFELGAVALQLDLTTLTDPVVVIEEISIDGATLNVEQKGMKSNVSDLYGRLKGRGGEGAEDTASTTDKRLVVEQFNFTGTRVNLLTEEQGEHRLGFPDFRESDIGDKDTGLAPDQLARALLVAVTKRLRGATQDYVESQLKERGTDAVMEKLEEKIGEDRTEMMRGILGVKPRKKDEDGEN